MANPSKARGTRWESEIRDGLRELGYDAEKLHLNGSTDEGDLVVRHGSNYFVIEAKNVKKILWSDFLRQASEEATEFGKNRKLDEGRVYPSVFVKRRQKGFQDGMVLLTVREYLRLLEGLS